MEKPSVVTKGRSLDKYFSLYHRFELFSSVLMIFNADFAKNQLTNKHHLMSSRFDTNILGTEF